MLPCQLTEIKSWSTKIKTEIKTNIYVSINKYYKSIKYLSQKQDKVPDTVDSCHTESIFHKDEESVSCRCAEAGAVNGRCRICVLKKSHTINASN